MNKRLRLGVIFGGRSGEHEVSVVSARSIMKAADKTKYEVAPLGVTRTGIWLEPGETQSLLQSEAKEIVVNAGRKALESLPKALEGIDVAFPIVHGTYGEDGTLQGLLEMADIPYIGAGVAGSAIGMDKALMKKVFVQSELPTPRFISFLRDYWQKHPGDATQQIEEQIGYPCFVKPANGGSSIGISRAASAKGLARALDAAAEWDRKLIVEEGINAREIECSVLGNDGLQASVLGEIVPSSDFYDYEAKYLSNDSRLIIPAELPDEKANEIRELAVRAYAAIDCAGMGRVDFLLDEQTLKAYVNEINTLPGFTSISMYPKLWEASGLSYAQLIDRLVVLALERHQEKKKSVVKA